MTREAEQRESRLRDDMEKLRIQQEQTLGTLDTKISAMIERQTQAIMDRLDGLLGSRNEPKDGEPNSGGPSREPRVNFNAQQNRRRTYGSTRGRGNSAGYATGDNRTWGPNIRGSSTGNRYTLNERPTQGTHATARGDSRNRSRASQGMSHASQGRNNPSESDEREVLSAEPLSGGNDTQAGLSREATSIATALEPLLLKLPSRSRYYKNNYGNFNNGPANQGNNWCKPRDDMDKRRSCANCSSTDHHVSACPTYKQGRKAIGFRLEDEDASEVDHEDFMRGVTAKIGLRCFFCNLKGHFKSDCPQFWDAVADIKHPRHEKALSGVKANKACLLSEAEARRKEKPQELATKKKQAVTEETCEPEPVTAADDFKIDYRAAARDALNRVQQELVTKEIEQKVKLELENEKLQEKLNAFEASEVEETKAPSSLSMKLNVISGQRFGMVPQGSKIQSIISVAGHQVIRNLSEPSEFTLMHLDTYAVYLRQVEPRTESRAVRALLTTGGPRIKKLHGRYVEVYGPYQVMLNVDGISIYTRTYVTTDSDQIGQIYLDEEELKVRRIRHDAIMEQDVVHIGYEADVTEHLLDTNGKKIGVTGLWTQER